MTPTAYRGRRALVIGGFGFIGAHLTARLQELGAAVTVATRSLGRYAASGLSVRALEADLRDADAIRSAVLGQDVVFNLAGESGAVRSMDDPWTDLDVNCRGNLVLLETLRTENAAATLVFVSSRLVYGEHEPQPVSEAQAAAPLCVHGVHKLAVEHYLRVYGRAYGLKAVVARLTNPYGPGQPSARDAYGVINRLIHRALANDTLPIYGDGRQQRDYIYIADAVEALVGLGGAAAAVGQTYNVGSGIGMALVEAAHTIVTIAGGGRLAFVEWPELARSIETGDFVADVGRLRRDLGWAPRVSFVDGLQRTIAHYRAHVA
jgi:UDP-glucose 4-epimerase